MYTVRYTIHIYTVPPSVFFFYGSQNINFPTKIQIQILNLYCNQFPFMYSYI